jgi:Glycosyl hydrolase family 76
VAVLSALTLVAGAAQTARAADVPPSDRQRASLAMHALTIHFYDRTNGLFYRTDHLSHPGGEVASLWELSHVLDAVALVPRLHRLPVDRDRSVTTMLGLLARYRAPGAGRGYTATPRTPGPAPQQFYDDNEWLGLDFVRLYEDGGTSGLAEARRLFAWIVTGWDRNPKHACNGGVFWQVGGGGDRNVVSNGPAAELGYRLYLITRDGYYLHWANRMYDWTRRCLDSKGGLYFDHMNLSGGLDRRMFTYVQGAMIGAGVLRGCSGGHSFAEVARRLALAAMAHFTIARLMREPPEFVDIYATDLLSLEALDHDASIRPYLQAYADDTWARAHDPASGLFDFPRLGAPQLDRQAAMVNIYSLLASASPPSCQ